MFSFAMKNAFVKWNKLLLLAITQLFQLEICGYVEEKRNIQSWGSYFLGLFLIYELAQPLVVTKVNWMWHAKYKQSMGTQQHYHGHIVKLESF